jgi:hypothetical protein
MQLTSPQDFSPTYTYYARSITMIISRWVARASIPDPPPKLITKKLKNTYRAEIKPFSEKAEISALIGGIQYNCTSEILQKSLLLEYLTIERFK